MSTRPDHSALILEHQGLVRALAWRISRMLPPGVEIDDLVGYGMVGLAKAASSFDPEKGQHFTTYAFYRVRGEILDNLRRMSWFDAAQFEGRVYEQAASASDDESGSAGEAAEGPRAAISPQAGAIHIEMRSRLRGALDGLPGEALELLRFVYYDGLSLAGAAKNLGISRSWACRLHGKALEVLALGMGLPPPGCSSESDG